MQNNMDDCLQDADEVDCNLELGFREKGVNMAEKTVASGLWKGKETIHLEKQGEREFVYRYSKSSFVLACMKCLQEILSLRKNSEHPRIPTLRNSCRTWIIILLYKHSVHLVNKINV